MNPEEQALLDGIARGNASLCHGLLANYQITQEAAAGFVAQHCTC